jgi:hypothetical protein
MAKNSDREEMWRPPIPRAIGSEQTFTLIFERNTPRSLAA